MFIQKNQKLKYYFSEPPGSPDNLTVLSVTSRTARVSWAITKAEPKIERFVVQWKKQHGKYILFLVYYECDVSCLGEI